MTLLEVIAQANELRPNAVADDRKAEWVNELEAVFADMLGEDAPVFAYPTDTYLLIEEPYQQVYVWYCAAMIDLAQQDTDLYQNDKAVADARIAEIKALHRRKNTPAFAGNWRTM